MFGLMAPLAGADLGSGTGWLFLYLSSRGDGWISELGHGPGRAIALVLQGEGVGAVSEPVEGGRAEQPIGEGVAPLGEVEVGGDDGGAAFLALGDEVVEVLVLRCPQGFQTEVIDDEQRNTSEGLEAPLVGVDGARGMEARQQLALGGEQHVVVGANGKAIRELQPSSPGEKPTPDNSIVMIVTDEHGRFVIHRAGRTESNRALISSSAKGTTRLNVLGVISIN